MNKTKLLPLIVSSLTCLTLVSCGNGNGGSSSLSSSSLSSSADNSLIIEPQETNILDDNYRNIYQIFPYAFADSNGDGIGDIKGIQDKLDYISSLGYTGLWLTPIHSSPTYHKYDVDDYKTIDSTFGTITDYDNLVSACHNKNMTILLDLVLNHTSSSNDWFTSCMEAHVSGYLSNPYYDYYNVQYSSNGSSVPSGYSRYKSSNYIYECRFWSGMPDLNLDYAMEDNSNLGKDIEDIISFWIKDHKVDGFRLDAVTSYFTGNQEKNKQFLSWIATKTKAINSKAYIVGEGSWSNPTENQKYIESGCDSFFNFEDAKADGYVGRCVNSEEASLIYDGMSSNLKVTKGGIAAPFVANHDTGRLLGAVAGKTDRSAAKFGNALLQMMNGCTFSYYGDEAGMSVVNPPSGTAKDEDKRQPMPWGDSYQCKPVSNSTSATDEQKYCYGTVKSQLEDPDSCVNFIKDVNALRNSNPEIARGSVTKVFASELDDFCVIKKTWDNKSVYLLINASSNSTTNYDISSLGEGKVVGSLCASDKYDKTSLVKKGLIKTAPRSIVAVR